MSKTKSGTSFGIGGVEALRRAVLGGDRDWPDPDGVDAAGAQLLAAAMRSGIEPPVELRDAPAMRRIWAQLGLDAVLPLDGGGMAP